MPIMTSSLTKVTELSEKPIGFCFRGGVYSNSQYPVHSTNEYSVNFSSNNQTNLPINVLQTTCCFVEKGVKCDRASCDASYSKQFEKQILQLKLPFTVDPGSAHANICEHHKDIIQTAQISCETEIDELIGDLSMKDFPDDS